MPGWETLIRVQRAVSWGTAGTIGNRGHFLYVDSESLDMGAQAAERDSKMTGFRESPVDTFSIDRYFPRGEITFQPRADDILMILMAHFQNVVKPGAGTYIFYRQDNALQWTEGGSNVGTHPYSVNIDVIFGQSFTLAGGTQANGIRFMNGIVDRFTAGLRYGEDLIMTPSFKFRAGSYQTYPNTFTRPSVYGSLSEYSRLVDYMGTVAISGESYKFESWEGVFNNNSADRSALGNRGYSRFPFAGKWIADGSFNMELQRDINIFKEGASGNLTANMFSAAGNQINIAQPNIRYRPFTIPVSGGDSIIELDLPYRAYPPSGTTGPSSQVTVYTGTAFGTDLLGF